MFDSNSYGKKILTGLLNQGWTVSGSTKTNPTNTTPFPTRVYLGLSTTTPSVNSATGAVTNFTEPSTGNYARVELTANGVAGSKLLSAADIVARDITVEDNGTEITSGTRYVARIRNHDENIMFPYTGEIGSGWGSDAVTHFGVFDAATGGKLIFFGELASSVTVSADRVPLILVDKFEITLG